MMKSRQELPTDHTNIQTQKGKIEPAHDERRKIKSTWHPGSKENQKKSNQWVRRSHAKQGRLNLGKSPRELFK